MAWMELVGSNGISIYWDDLKNKCPDISLQYLICIYLFNEDDNSWHKQEQLTIGRRQLTRLNTCMNCSTTIFKEVFEVI